jgi:hypothetical protein
MKRLLLLLALTIVVFALGASPAYAWLAPQHDTAYISPYSNPVGWVEWVGNSNNPFATVDHTDAIPHGWNVVVAVTWADLRLGATLVPCEVFHTLSIAHTTGCPTYKLPTAASALRYWSRPYQWDSSADPKVWARDWWVPLGKMPAGDYTGLVREWAPRAFPTWIDPVTGADLDLAHPYILAPYDTNNDPDNPPWTVSFTVASR